MTGRELIDVLARHVTFLPGIASKRFVRDMAATPADYVLSERAEAYSWRIAAIYRRQLPREIAEEALRRKVLHQWTPPAEGADGTWKCAVCLRGLRGERERNAPCPGPPPPPKPRKPRVKRAGAAVDASPVEAPMLFGQTGESA
jgi:hypothetical protein